MSNITGTVTELVYASQAAGAAQNTFTAERTLFTTAEQGERPSFPANLWTPTYGRGRGFRVIARGILSSTGTPTYTWSIRLGANGSTTAAIVLGTAALTTGSGVSNQPWELEGDVIFESVATAGNSSTVRGTGLLLSPGLASPFMYLLYGGAASPGTVATVDPSITNYVNVNIACSASSASNTITLHQLLVFGLN